MAENILEQGVKFNPSKVGVRGLSQQQGEGYKESFFASLGRAGNKIVLDLAQRENQEKHKELAEAERDLKKIENANDDVSFMQTQAKLKSLYEEYQRNNVGKSYLSSDRPNQLAGLYTNSNNIIANAKGLKVTSKERLKNMSKELYESHMTDFKIKNYQENRRATETNLLNLVEDARIKGQIAIQEGRQEDAIHWANMTKEGLKKLGSFDPNRYNHKWVNKASYELDYEYGLGIANKAFTSIREEYLKSPMDAKSFQEANKKYNEVFVNLSTVESFKAMTGSEDGLAHQEFIQSLSRLKDSNLGTMKKLSEAITGTRGREKEREVYKWKQSPVDAYAYTRQIDKVPQEAYSLDGDLISAQMNEVHSEFLKEKGITISNNAQAYEVMKKYPEKFKNETINIIPSAMGETLKNEFIKGNYEGINDLLNAQFGENKDEDFRRILSDSILNATGGQIDLEKIEVLTGRTGTDEERKVYSEINNFKNVNENFAQFKNVNNRTFANQFKGANLQVMDSLLALSTTDNAIGLKAKNIVSDMNYNRFQIYSQNMTEKERKEWYDLSNEKKEKAVYNYFEDNVEARKLAEQRDEAILQANLGNDRPVTINGYSEMVDKNTYSQDYLEEYIEKLPEKKLYFTDDNGVEKVIGKHDSKTLTRVVSNSENNDVNIYFGNKKVYEKVDGVKKPLVVPHQPAGWEKEGFWDFFGF